MAAIDMSVSKFYIKMHSTRYFFSHLKKCNTCHCAMLRVFSIDLVYQSQMFFQSLLND